MKKMKPIKKKTLQKAVSESSKLEGLSWYRAKQNKAIIKKLKQHGRAFTI
ncbi:hypothetical protein KKH43_05490 [Patescibacteria group bacterium]|nr:hypothetical protein [Patescibacteria group bacterium]